MNIQIPITKKRIQNHFNYFWWAYVLIIALAILGWNLIHTVTRYQSPPELKVEWFFGGYQTDNGTGGETLMKRAHQEVLPDMEVVSYLQIMTDDAYGSQSLTTWAFAGEGDLYTLNRESFQNMAGGGAMMNLQPYVDSGELNVDGIDLTGCYVTVPESGEQWLCGIPMSALPGLSQYSLYGDDHIMCVLINGGNDANTVKLLGWLLENFREPAELPVETVPAV